MDQRFVDAMEALREIADVAVPVKGGKTYIMVKDRIEIFRREFGDEFGIVSNVDYSAGFDDGAPVVASCQITKGDRVIASGWAVEFVGSTKITAASPIEVAETSAIGRALASFGLAGGEYASLNEMEAHERKESRPLPSPDKVREQWDKAKVETPQPAQAQPQARTGNGPAKPRPWVRSDETPFYVPTDHDAIWLQPDLEANNIMAEVESIQTTQDLGRYWSDLKGFVALIKKEQPDMLAEIKAAFATRHNAIAGEK